MRNKGFQLIEHLQAYGRIVFTAQDVQKILNLPRINSLALLSSLKKQKRIVTLTRGLYALWHPSERKWGIRPLPILDHLMRFMKHPYYVGLLSAADYYGAAHQKPQQLQVMIPKQIHLRTAKNLGLSFHVKKNFSSKGIEKQKTPSGYILYSSPELTALDILGYPSASGGFGNACVVIRALRSQMSSKRLKGIIEAYPVVASVQRLGFLLEFFKSDPTLLKPLKAFLKKKSPPPVSLVPSYPKQGSVIAVWNLFKNGSVETQE